MKQLALVGMIGLAVALVVLRRTHTLAYRLVFEEVTERAGLRFTHFNEARCSIVPEDVASGLAWGDYDDDGDDDLLLVNFAGCLLRSPEARASRPGNQLYRNNGNGTFTEVTSAARLARADWCNAALWFDYDNDGRLDLAITHFQGILLYRNCGDGTFDGVTETAGLAGLRRYFLGMTAGDYDRDGDLDLYVCGYLRFDREAARAREQGGKRPRMGNGRLAVWTSPVPYPAEPNALLRNNGDGTFTDVAAPAGVTDPQGKSMQAVFADFDNDGWLDLYVGNDVSTPDVLFRNRRDGTFAEVSMVAGTHDFRATMGIALGDLWHRGWLDLATTHWVNEEHGLWKNVTPDAGSLAFDDLAPARFPRKSLAYVGWGCGFHDFDNDGWLDFLVGNGSTVEQEPMGAPPPRLIPQPAEVYRHDPDTSRFVSQHDMVGERLRDPASTRGVAFADYDRDGRVDVAVLRLGERAQLFRNVSRSGHWLQVRARGGRPNRHAVNARVRVRAGAQWQTRELTCGGSYLSQDSQTAHFGLGVVTRADVEVTFYPSGRVRRLAHVGANRVVTIAEDESSP